MAETAPNCKNFPNPAEIEQAERRGPCQKAPAVAVFTSTCRFINRDPAIMTVRPCIFALATVALSACAPPPTPKPILHPTSISDAERHVIEEAARDGLKDPDSAKFRHPQLYFGNEIYCLEVNAKNAFGGYTGFLPVEMFVTRIDGKIKVAAPIAYATANPNDGRTRAVIQICADNGY